jgi:hypothetical protein
MPTVRYTADGGRYRTAGVTFEPGDEHVVPTGKAEHLVEDVGDFEYVDRDETAGDGATDDADPEADGEELADGDGDGDAGDGDEFDIEAWLDIDYGDRTAKVEAGEVDDHLDTIAEAETSETVLDAIGVRRAELAED